jgi:phage/plasmid-like protein (TIGR03299 family)
MSDAVETMAYVEDRGLPWWTDGSDPRGRGLDALATSEEMAEASGLNWGVNLTNIALANGPFAGREFDERFATVRDSDGFWLGVVGRNYQIIQNSDAFAFGDNLVDSGEAKWETAGSLNNGRVVFMSMELNHLDLRLEGEHPEGDIKTYLLLSNAHDGSRALEADITKVRTVCKNTLNVAVGSATRRFKIRHSGSTDGKIEAARKALGIAFTYDKAFEAAANRLLDKRLVDEQVQAIFRKVWPIDVEEATEGRLETHASTLAFETYKTSADLDPIRGTAWAALNAVAEYVDHEQQYRGRYQSIEDVRAQSILWGSARGRKQAAFDLLMKVPATK